ncbi:MAG: hypothetical protein N2314_05250 [Brevinematales bacterium]|nr:hypothetical protein [Brevinematales bacterium]
MKRWFFLLFFILFGSFAFAGSLSLTVLSYVGSLEYASMELGPWKKLDIDETIPEKGYLRLTSANDSAELLRSDGVLVRLVGKTMVSVESLFQAPKPKQGLSGLLRKKRPLIEIKNEVAVAAVRGSVQSGRDENPKDSTTNQKIIQNSCFSVGIGGLSTFDRSGVLIKGGYSNDSWQIAIRLPILWNTNGLIDTQWKSADGWFALVETLTIGKETEFFFLSWGEKEITLGEGFLFERRFYRYHPSRFSENFLFAQINFGDVGIRGLVDRPADPDLWAVEAFIRPFWGTETTMEKFIIKGFVVNERDALSPFFPGDFQTTNGSVAYVTGYGLSASVPLLSQKLWYLSINGEIDGLNEKGGMMVGVSGGHEEWFSLTATLGRGESGYLPWYFDTLSRYTRPISSFLLSQTTHPSLAWSIGGTIGTENSIQLGWNLKHRGEKEWMFQSGITSGNKVSPFSLFVGSSTTWTENTPAFDPERTLTLVRFGLSLGNVKLSTEYAQALSTWEKGSFSIMGEVRF